MFKLLKKRKSTIPITIINKRKETLIVSRSENNGIQYINIALKPNVTT